MYCSEEYLLLEIVWIYPKQLLSSLQVLVNRIRSWTGVSDGLNVLMLVVHLYEDIIEFEFIFEGQNSLRVAEPR